MKSDGVDRHYNIFSNWCNWKWPRNMHSDITFVLSSSPASVKAWRNSFISNFASVTERVKTCRCACLCEQQGRYILVFLSWRILSHHPINRTRREGRREAPDSRTDTEQLSNKNFTTPFPFCWQHELTQSIPFPIGRLNAGTSLTDDVICEFRTGITRSLSCFWQLKALTPRCEDRSGSKQMELNGKKRTKKQLTQSFQQQLDSRRRNGALRWKATDWLGFSETEAHERGEGKH